MTLIKSISGIRGTIGGAQSDNLTPIDIVKFSTAYSSWLTEQTKGKKLTVVLGRDARISGPMVENLIAGTLMGCGINIINVGLCTTPGVEMAVINKKADGGIIITASHNPSQWNALKLLNNKGEFLSDSDGKRILELAESLQACYSTVEELGQIVETSSFDDEHIACVLALRLCDKEAVKQKRYKVVVDAVNSVGGVVIPKLLREMGVDVVEINCVPDGNFAHNPEPLPDNLRELSERVVSEKADLGIAVDPDVDRIAFICEDGSMFGEEYTLVAVADYVLSATPGSTVSNLSSSRALRDVTEKHGCSYSAAAVGEVNVVAKMKETGAVIGGEGNGGVIYPELHYGRDALVGAVLFLSHLAHSGKTATALRASYPDYHISKNKIELTADIDVDNVLESIKSAYAHEQVCDIDGVKIDFEDKWVHLRKSNTEPIIRIYCECRDKAAADQLANVIMGNIRDICSK